MESRKTELLAMLLKENRLYSYEELSTHFNISKRLLRYSIEKANEVLRFHKLHEITKVHGKGIYIEVAEDQRDFVREKIFVEEEKDVYASKEDREIMILFSILNMKEVKIFAHDFQTMFDVSKSAIDADMRSLRADCKSFNIKIISTPKQGFQLQGDEWAIRLMLNNIINTKFDILQLLKSSSLQYLTTKEKVVLKYLGEKDVKMIFNTLRKSVSDDGIVDNELYCAQLSIYFAFWKKRYLNHDRMKKDDCFIQKYEKRHSQQMVSNFLRQFDVENIEEAERNYLDFMVDSLNLQRNQSFSKDWVKCQLLSIQFMNEMSKVRSIPYHNETTLFENLFQHMGALMKRLKEGIEIYNPLKNMVKKEYPSVFEAVQTVCKILKHEFDSQLSEEEVAYLSIHFSAAEEKIRDRMKMRYRVVVVCGHGIATGELLAENLKRQYQFDVIGIISSYEVHAISRLDADFVLKTTDTEIKYLPSLQINPMLAHEDDEKIKFFIQENEALFKNQELKINQDDLFEELIVLAKAASTNLKEEEYRKSLSVLLKKHEIEIVEKGMQPMISDLLIDENIQLNVKAKDWEDAICKVAKPLLDEEFISSHYVEAMIESVHEYGPYIVIGEGIALAHARPSDGVSKLGISVMTLDPPICFNHDDHDPVSLIFCLAAIDNYAHLKMMATIVRLINEDGKIEELSKQHDVEVFKKVLFALEK